MAIMAHYGNVPPTSESFEEMDASETAAFLDALHELLDAEIERDAMFTKMIMKSNGARFA